MKQKLLASWVCRAALICVFAVSAASADEQVVLIGSVSFDSGPPVVGGTIRIVDMRNRFLRRLPKSVLLATEVSDADGQFRVELDDIRGYLDIRLVYEGCRWTGALKVIEEDELRDNDVIRVDLITQESVACSGNE